MCRRTCKSTSVSADCQECRLRRRSETEPGLPVRPSRCALSPCSWSASPLPYACRSPHGRGPQAKLARRRKRHGSTFLGVGASANSGRFRVNPNYWCSRAAGQSSVLGHTRSRRCPAQLLECASPWLAGRNNAQVGGHGLADDRAVPGPALRRKPACPVRVAPTPRYGRQRYSTPFCRMAYDFIVTSTQ